MRKLSSGQFLFVLAMTLSGSIGTSAAWGRVGHEIVMVNAVELLTPELRSFFKGRKKRLNYYADVPDISWKTRESYPLEGGTHYVNSEHFKLSPFDDKFPSEIAEARLLFVAPADKPKMTFEQNGTLPWRAKQFHTLLTESFERAGKQEATRFDVETVRLRSGLLSHYIADASQPLHSTIDHNGKLSGHEGIHSYLEGKIVGELAKNHKLRESSLEVALSKNGSWARITDPENPARLALNILKDSNPLIAKIYELDDRYAILQGKPLDLATEALRRKPPAEVAPHFAKLLAERLALSSSALARLIEHAWLKAGKPALTETLIHRPSFIPPVY